MRLWHRPASIFLANWFRGNITRATLIRLTLILLTVAVRLALTAALTIALTTVALLAGAVPSLAQSALSQNSAAAPIAKTVGTIKSVQVGSITVAAESGDEVTATLTESTKILRVPPGEKDLKNAVALQPQDLQPGDRVLVRGQSSSNPRALTALSVIVMKQSDVAAKQQQQQEDWQKRGVGGLVTKADAATNTITISSNGTGPNKNIIVHLTPNTIARRYAPGSVKFDDAKPQPAAQFMAEIKPGDQLRARGTRSADGGELAAEETVAGSFRNIAGTIKSIDAPNNTITVQDAITKSAVTVKVLADSQIKKLPPEMAQRIAMRLKAQTANASGDQAAANAPDRGQSPSQSPSQSQGKGESQSAANAPGAAPNGSRGRNGADGQGRSGGGAGGSGPPDLQRMLSRLPNSTLADLQKADAVMIVATEGAGSDAATAITLLAGVDAILTASPNRSASLLSPWSLGAPSAEGEGAQQ
jgi:hypothetical protein